EADPRSAPPLQPAADHSLHPASTGGEAASRVELVLIVGEQVHVLTDERFAQQLEHLAADAATAIRRMRPHVDDVGVADAVRQRARSADAATPVAGVGAAEARTERTLHLVGGPSVIEMVGGELGLELRPIDSVAGSRVDNHY